MNIDEAILIPELAKLGMYLFGGFALSMLLTPIYTYFAYKYQWWKKVKTEDMGGKSIPVFHKLHAAKHKRNVPSLAGVVIWLTVALITLAFNFNRSETWLPLFTLVAMGVLGLVDDYFNITSKGGRAGIRAKLKILWTVIAASVGAYWFYYKLGWDSIHIPAYGDITIGWLYIPLFIFIVLALTIPINQKRIVTLYSGHPIASKW